PGIKRTIGTDRLPYSYAQNMGLPRKKTNIYGPSYGAAYYNPFSPFHIKEPSRTAIFLESTVGLTINYTTPAYSPWDPMFYFGVRHPGKTMNATFVDGHSEARLGDEIAIPNPVDVSTWPDGYAAFWLGSSSYRRPIQFD
ncbi:MAG TPA: hypothetical protein VF184_00355, partial [Phycisphaeraceae bacterium]